MNLMDIVNRIPNPEPWVEGEKIPWDDPAFSKRMLKEHLTQDHDRASRRFPKIDRHVAWLHHHVLSGKASRILDLGCGPGLYTNRLARMGHECTGIDFAPASVDYAREQADQEKLNCTYHLGDIREEEFGAGHDLIMFTNGEFNVFKQTDAALIVNKAYGALSPGGQILLEAHTFAAVKAIGEAPASWYSSAGGLFSTEPHLCLTESIWIEGKEIAIERYYIVNAASAHVARHAGSIQAYDRHSYRQILVTGGFEAVTFYPSLLGEADSAEDHYLVALARKSEHR
jgi:SAM-dependent methyltransferase